MALINDIKISIYEMKLVFLWNSVYICNFYALRDEIFRVVLTVARFFKLTFSGNELSAYMGRRIAHIRIQTRLHTKTRNRGTFSYNEMFLRSSAMEAMMSTLWW